MKIRLVVVLFILSLIAASCGGDDSSQTDPTTAATTKVAAEDLPDPCDLITQTDVDSIFEGSPPDPDSTMSPGPGGIASGRSCSWSKIAALSVSIFVRPSFLTPMGVCDYCSPIDGLGDEAWAGESDRGSGGSLVAVVVDGLGVQVRADGLDASVDDLLPLARSVLGGLTG